VATFTFDDAAPSLGPTLQFDAEYFGVRSWQFVFDRGYIFGSSDPTKDTLGETDIANNNSTGYFYPTDRYIVTFDYSTSTGLPLPSGRDFNFLQIDLGEEEPLGDPKLLSAITLPTTPPPLALVNLENGRLVYEGIGIPDQPHFVVDSFIAVPEPPAVALSLLAGLGFVVIEFLGSIKSFWATPRF
jgi:hypothetical protein